MIRIHKTAKTIGYRHITVCGRRTNPYTSFVTEDSWDNVTCQRCLAHRGQLPVLFSGDVPETLKAWANAHADVIQEVSEEGVDGYWVYFRPGYIDTEAGTHQEHEYSLAALKARWQFVKPE